MLPRDTPLFFLAHSHLWFGGVSVCYWAFFILGGFWKACCFKATMISVGREVETQDYLHTEDYLKECSLPSYPTQHLLYWTREFHLTYLWFLTFLEPFSSWISSVVAIIIAIIVVIIIIFSSITVSRLHPSLPSFLYYFIFQDDVFWWFPYWLWTCHRPASDSHGLKWQACTTMSVCSSFCPESFSALEKEDSLFISCFVLSGNLELISHP